MGQATIARSTVWKAFIYYVWEYKGKERGNRTFGLFVLFVYSFLGDPAVESDGVWRCKIITSQPNILNCKL
jgi:hypothetical protein